MAFPGRPPGGTRWSTLRGKYCPELAQPVTLWQVKRSYTLVTRELDHPFKVRRGFESRRPLAGLAT